MQQIEVFEGSTHNATQDANTFLKQHPNYKVVNTTIHPMWDFYAYCPTQICNQWVAIIVTYEVE